MPERETSAEIDETAAEWVLRIDDAALSREEQVELDAWLQGDVRRVGAFARAQAVLIHAKRAKALGAGFEPEAYALEDERAPTIEPIAGPEPAPAILTRRRMLIGTSAVAASVAIALYIPAKPASARIFETGRGESRLIPLDDGSSVTLNTLSRIAVSQDRGLQIVRLDHGEALFHAAGGGIAQLEVDAGDTSLMAKSAKFVVCRFEDQPVEIKVCEGSVQVARKTFAAGQTHLLSQNMRATLSPNGAIIERNLAPETIERELAWQQGMLSFEDTRLTQAVQEFARYSERTISIADPAVAAETVTGRFASNDPEGFARAVALGLNLRARPTPEGIALER